MNPQQFQNMQAMGRGMPNANMQQMNTNNAMNLQKYIIQSLNQDGPFTGWQAEIPLPQRAQQVKLLVDSLRLLGPPVELSRAVDVALNFERKEFAQQPTKEEYLRECAEKLNKIRDQRQQHLRTGGMNGGQNMQMMNPAFQQMQQMNRQMGMQQRLSQVQPGMQPSPMMGQQFGQQANPGQQMNPQLNQMQRAMQQPQNQQRPMEPSAEDNAIINQRAADLAKNTSPEDMRTIVENMPLKLKQILAGKNIEPIAYHFRMEATKEFRNSRGDMANIANQRMNNQFNMMPMSGGQQHTGNVMMNQNTQQNSTPFMLNPDQFRGQQEAGLRSQEEGHLVVPASNNQNMTPEQARMQQQLIANQQRMAQQNQAMNPQFAEQQRRLKMQLQGQQRLQAAQQMHNQAQNQARLDAAAAQNGMQNGMQNMSQGQNNMQNIGQQNNMNMLNRPVGPNMPVTSPQPPRPVSRAPIPGQQVPVPPQMAQAQPNAQQVYKREQFLSQFPPQLQAILRTKPPTEWSAIATNFKNSQAAQMRRTVSQQAGGPQPGQQSIQQLPTGQFVGGNLVGPSPMQQSLSAGQAVNPQVPQMGNNMQNIGQQHNPQMLNGNQELLRQQREMQMRQQQAKSATQPQPQNSAEKRPLTQQEMTQMDQHPVAPQILRSIQAQGLVLPEIKNWMHLKHWLKTNPSPRFTPQTILQLQAQHYHHLTRNRNQAQAQAQANLAQMQAMQQQQSQQPQAPAQNIPQNRPQPQMPSQGMSQIRPITDSDIQRVRQTNERAQGMTDEEIRNILMARQRQMQEQALQNQMLQGQQPQQMKSLQVPPEQQMRQQVSQISGGDSQAQPPNMAGQRPSSARPTPQVQQPTTVQQEYKGVKRPNEDSAEGNQSQLRNPQMTQTNMTRTLTKEEFEKLDPAKQRQYMEAKKREEQKNRTNQAVQKITELGREIQSTMVPLRPITNMDANNRKRIIALLTNDNTKNVLSRFDSFLVGFYMMERDEPTMRQLLTNRHHLVAQYKPQAVANKTFEPNDHFSISAENVEKIIGNITSKLQQVTAKYAQAGKPSQQQPVPLTAENLAQAQAQAAQQQKKGQKSKDGPPPAPTGEKPPFALGDNRGQGTPKYATDLKQDDIKLDLSKRRKKNPPATPATATTASPEIVKEQKASPQQFKCTVAGCQHQNKGFANQAALDEHFKAAHQRPQMEPVTDPLAFLDNSLRQAFDLDEHFQPNKKPEAPVPIAPLMQKTVSKAGSNLKIESKPSTPIPMVRGQSQQTGKPSTPNMLKTPQSGTEALKATMQKPPQAQQLPDAWSNVDVGHLNDAFGDFEWNEVMPTFDAENLDLDGVLETYMQSDEWQKIMNDGVGANSHDGSTDKSKSPDQGSEPSAQAKEQKQPVQKDDLDLTFDGIDMADGFEDLIMSDAQLQAAQGSIGNSPWELTERPSPPQQAQSGQTDQMALDTSANNPFASASDPELEAWLNEPISSSNGLYVPLGPNGFPDPAQMSPFEEINFDEFMETGAPSNWTTKTGTMEWNAIGKPGEDIRRELGWPVEGAQVKV